MREHLRIEAFQHYTPPLVRFGVVVTDRLTSRLPPFPSTLQVERVAARFPESFQLVDGRLKFSD